jgi:hypothetical protein
LYYEKNGIVVGDLSEGRWEHAHIVPRCEGKTETVLLLYGHHIMHDLYQSREYNRTCFFSGTTRAWLYGEGFLCENWFELVELYEHYMVQHAAWLQQHLNATPGMRARCIAAAVDGTRRLLATATDEEKRQRTAAAVAAWSALTPTERRERFYSDTTSEYRKRRMAKANEAMMGWRSTIDGFVSTASGVAKHNRHIGADPTAKERIAKDPRAVPEGEK